MTAGGTCGNVMMILSSLGWSATPIGRLGDDAAGAVVIADMQRWGVDVGRLQNRPSASTPVIVVRIRRDTAGIPFHSFGFSCPGCGGRFPGFQPVTSSSVANVVADGPAPEVLFIDRVSRSAILLAEALSSRGTVIFFEPSGVGNPAHFGEILNLAHIVKYSDHRLADLGDLVWGPQMVLEMQTLGRGGLRFRTSLEHSGSLRNGTPSKRCQWLDCGTRLDAVTGYPAA